VTAVVVGPSARLAAVDSQSSRRLSPRSSQHLQPEHQSPFNYPGILRWIRITRGDVQRKVGRTLSRAASNTSAVRIAGRCPQFGVNLLKKGCPGRALNPAMNDKRKLCRVDGQLVDFEAERLNKIPKDR
jgi:hypothetical protein